MGELLFWSVIFTNDLQYRPSESEKAEGGAKSNTHNITK